MISGDSLKDRKYCTKILKITCIFFYFASFLRVNGRICVTNQSCSRRLSRTTENTCFLCQYTNFSLATLQKKLRHCLQYSCTHQAVLHRCISSSVCKRSLPTAFPVVDGAFQLIHRHVFEANLQNSQACQQRYDTVIYIKPDLYLYLFTFLTICSSYTECFSL